jgi:hypothetical protein
VMAGNILSRFLDKNYRNFVPRVDRQNEPENDWRFRV